MKYFDSHDKNGILRNSMAEVFFDANKLEGTAKQKAYAQDIINRAFKNIDNKINEIQEDYRKRIERTDSDTYRAEANAAIQSYLNIKQVIVQSLGGKMDTAEKVIKNKWQLENALPRVRETLEVKYQKQYWKELNNKKN